MLDSVFNPLRSSASPEGRSSHRAFTNLPAALKISTLSTANLAFSYHGSLRYYTTEPIRRIFESQNDTVKLRELLVQFRNGKKEELDFVNKAAAIAAAAVVGVFSWPEVLSSFWLCPFLWHCSFWFSIFALISSAQHRLLEQLPKCKADAADMSREEVRNATLLILREKYSLQDRAESHLWAEEDRALYWLWQAPMMLMSLSWVTFLIGFEAYVASPLLSGALWTVEKSSAVAVQFVGLLVVANFMGCGLLARATIEEFRDREWSARTARRNSV